MEGEWNDISKPPVMTVPAEEPVPYMRGQGVSDPSHALT